MIIIVLFVVGSSWTLASVNLIINLGVSSQYSILLK